MFNFNEMMGNFLQGGNPSANTANNANDQYKTQAMIKALLNNNQGNNAQPKEEKQQMPNTEQVTGVRGYTPKIEVGETFVDKYFDAKNNSDQNLMQGLGKFFGAMIGG